MEAKRDLNFEIGNADHMNLTLKGLFMDVRRGQVDPDTAKSLTLIADKIIKNAVAQTEYKKITKHNKNIPYLDYLQD